MKAVMYDVMGKKKKDIDLPKIFGSAVRQDIVMKFYEVDKFMQPYASDPKGGKKHSASGTISHKRHDWKGHYGSGRSRIPRKTMWRRGVNFHWIGAEISSTRGGRRAHPPKGIGKEKRINKKEIKVAMNSAFAASGNDKFVVERYGRLDKLNVKVPVVVESKIEGMKTKEILNMLRTIYGEVFDLVLKKKEVRAGKGKLRGRKYKSNAGLLFVKGSDEKIKINGVDVKSVDEVSISDLYPLGRLSAYTEKALEELK